MDGRFDAIKHFQVKLGKLVLCVSRSFLDISQRGGIDNIANNESLDGLILGDRLAGRYATNTFDVSASMLVATVIAPLDSHNVK
jgi:hypothetical protein